MKSEFLVIPILAYLSLLFIQKLKKDERIYILFFAFLGLVGAFLAKGANEPFGEVYVWVFLHIPGFIMFRDPTKWYALVALSYSILIPFSIWKIYRWLQDFQKLKNVFLIFTIIYLLFLLIPAMRGDVKGNLQTTTVPKEYVEFKNFLISQNGFSRVLWIPTLQRFTFYSNTHPAIPGKNFFNTYDEYGVVNNLKKSNVQKRLQEGSVKYIVVPDDTQKEVFIKDRKYDATQYKKTVEKLEKIPWLRKAHVFGRIVVFELDNPKDHFWSNNKNLSIKSTLIDPTKYVVTVNNAHKNDRVVFSETFDKNWEGNYNGQMIYSQPYNKLFNSFVLPKDGSYTFTVSYKPQEFVNMGLFISIGTIIITSMAVVFCFIKRK